MNTFWIVTIVVLVILFVVSLVLAILYANGIIFASSEKEPPTSTAVVEKPPTVEVEPEDAVKDEPAPLEKPIKGMGMCDLKYSTDNKLCKDSAKQACTAENTLYQPCGDSVYSSCLKPVPVASNDLCAIYAKDRCVETMNKCNQKRQECLDHYDKEFPGRDDLKSQCKICARQDLCEKEMQKECKKYVQCWSPFVAFIKENVTKVDYADVWHTLKVNNINSKKQLVDSSDPMKFWPPFVGKQGSKNYNEIKDAILALRLIAKSN